MLLVDFKFCSLVCIVSSVEIKETGVGESELDVKSKALPEGVCNGVGSA